MRLATLVTAFLLLCVPVACAAGTTTSPTPLVGSVPFLTATMPVATATTPTVTGPAATVTTPTVPATTPSATGAATSTTASATPNGDLPYTGLDLLPETIAAVALILGGVVLRLRLAPHRRWRSRW